MQLQSFRKQIAKRCCKVEPFGGVINQHDWSWRLTLEVALAVSVAVALADSNIVGLALTELKLDIEKTNPGNTRVVTA